MFVVPIVNLSNPHEKQSEGTGPTLAEAQQSALRKAKQMGHADGRLSTDQKSVLVTSPDYF